MTRWHSQADRERLEAHRRRAEQRHREQVEAIDESIKRRLKNREQAAA